MKNRINPAQTFMSLIIENQTKVGKIIVEKVAKMVQEIALNVLLPLIINNKETLELLKVKINELEQQGETKHSQTMKRFENQETTLSDMKIEIEALKKDVSEIKKC